MIELFNNFIIPLLSGIFKQIINMFTAPLYLAIKHFIPDITIYLNMVDSFITNYIIKGMQFFKMSLLNITGINHDVWTFVSGSLFIALYLYVSLSFLKLAYNLWSIFKGTKKVE